MSVSIVDLYLGNLDDLHVDVDAAVLSPDERRRAAALRGEALRRRYCARHALLRRVLGERIGLPPGRVEMALGSKDKPHVVGGPSFNMSSSGPWLLIGVADRGSLGVDIECVRTVPQLLDIAARYFSPAEADALRKLDLTERELAFFRCWSRKEAVVKAVGGGLSIPLASFTVSLQREGGNVLLDAGHALGPGSWLVYSVIAPEGAEAAVAWDQGPFECRRHLLAPSAAANENATRRNARAGCT